jgi:hypothetical protein
MAEKSFDLFPARARLLDFRVGFGPFKPFGLRSFHRIESANSACCLATRFLRILASSAASTAGRNAQSPIRNRCNRCGGYRALRLWRSQDDVAGILHPHRSPDVLIATARPAIFAKPAIIERGITLLGAPNPLLLSPAERSILRREKSAPRSLSWHQSSQCLRFQFIAERAERSFCRVGRLGAGPQPIVDRLSRFLTVATGAV